MKTKSQKAWSISWLWTWGESTVRQYIDEPDKYVTPFTVQINGKKRHIITYKQNKYGAALKNLHGAFADIISGCYESVPNSFAYKRGTGIRPCLEKHLLSNVFLKSDVYEFFNSIQYERLLEEILKDRTCKRRCKIIGTILETCFYDGHLPIGFVTSPVLSDLYLHDLDKSFLGKEGVVFTRYADDFIISGCDNLDQLIQVKAELEKNLSEYGLSLNTKKTYFRTLRQPGDAIHVLGVNIVNNFPEPNRITVSDKYIREVSKEICLFFDEKDDMTQSRIHETLLSLTGKIEFIRYISASSYRKLERMINIKSGRNLQLDELKIQLKEQSWGKC